jgi:hypothetical protein
MRVKKRSHLLFGDEPAGTNSDPNCARTAAMTSTVAVADISQF